VTRNELYGFLHPATREWKEGIISNTFRDMANNKTNKHQWIILDGDIDAEWIEVSLCDLCLLDYNLSTPWLPVHPVLVGFYVRPPPPPPAAPHFRLPVPNIAPLVTDGCLRDHLRQPALLKQP